MLKIKTALTVEQIVESIGRLSEDDQRRLAALALENRALEAFIEELEDILACERAAEESPVEPFTAEELTRI